MSLENRLKSKFPTLEFETAGGCDDAIIKNVESKLGLIFPADFVQYLREFGQLSVGHFDFFGQGKDIPEFLDLCLVAQSEWQLAGLSKSLLPICNNGGGDLYCLDCKLSTTLKSVICFVPHETHASEKIADGIEEWLCEKLASLVE